MLLLASSHAAGTVLYVPQQYSTITQAANAAVAGDTVLVAHPPVGWYPNETIVIKPGVSVIGDDDSVRVWIREGTITFSAGVEPARLEWFSIRPPTASESVISHNPACEIRHNRIVTTNPPLYFSIALLLGGLVEYNEIVGSGDGSGISVIGDAMIRHNSFRFLNPAVRIEASPGHVQVRNNNVIQTGISLSLHQDTIVDIVNNLFLSGGGIWPPGCNSRTSIRYNDFVSGWSYPVNCTLGPGNIANVDPMFCNQPGIETWLHAASPVAHAGEDGSYIGAYGVGCGVTSVVNEEAPLAMLKLAEIFPNPTRGNTHVRFELGMPNQVVIEVFDVSGRIVKRHALGYLAAGRHSVPWDLRQENRGRLGVGLYYVRVSSSTEAATRRVVIVR